MAKTPPSHFSNVLPPKQALRLCTPKVGGLGLIPGQGTRSHVKQVKFFSFAPKTWCN